MKSSLYQYLLYSFTITCFLVLFINTSENAYFWDTVQLGSLHATFYFDSNFNELILPQGIDSGHIPAFGMYIAFMWKLFGRSLLVSHLAMLPFILLLFWQTYRLVSYFFDGNHKAVLFMLLLFDSVLLAQSTLVSPDILLTTFFIMAFNLILRDKKILLSIAIILLFLTSMRGMMVSLCLLFLDIWLHISWREKIVKIFKKLALRSLIYLPALFLFIAFSYQHYSSTGWIGYHDDSPWAGSFESVDFKGFFRNIGIYGWRLLDFGRTISVLIFFILGIYGIKRHWNDAKSRILILVSLIFILLFPMNMLWASGLLLHRYLLPVSLLITLSAAYFLWNSAFSNSIKNSVIVFWLIVLTTGNLWIYPDKIAQGWDATLAHLPYYELQKEAINYFDDHNINLNRVETFFPSQGTIDAFQLNNDYRIIDGFEGKREYVIYSNINNITDQEYHLIHSSAFELKKHLESNGVFVKIFKKR